MAGRQFHSAQTQLLPNTPYTLAAALQPSPTQCRLVLSVPNLDVIHASDAFADRAAGFSKQMQGLHFLAGASTNQTTLSALTAAARAGLKAAGVTTVYPTSARPCHARLQVSPLLGPGGQLDHVLLVLTPLLCDEAECY